MIGEFTHTVEVENVMMNVRFSPDFAFKRTGTDDEGWFEMLKFKKPNSAIRKLFNLVKEHKEVVYYVKDDREIVYKKLMERMGFKSVKRDSVSPTTLKYRFIKT